MATWYQVVDVLGDRVVGWYWGREEAARDAERRNEGRCDGRFQVRVVGNDCPRCGGRSVALRIMCVACFGTGRKGFYQ